MQENIFPLKPTINFTIKRTTKGLIDLLNNFEVQELVFDTALTTLLINDAHGLVSNDHSSIYAFNRDLWDALGNLSLDVPWWQFLEEANKFEDEDKDEDPTAEEDQKEISAESPLQQSLLTIAARNSLIDAIKADADRSSLQISKNEYSLKFFDQINQILPEVSPLVGLVDHAKEISQLLCRLAVTAPDLKKNKRNLAAYNWNWLFPAICQSYLSFLPVTEDTKKSDLNTDVSINDQRLSEFAAAKRAVDRAAIEVVGFFSILTLSSLAINGIEQYKTLALSFRKYAEALEYINDKHPLYALLFSPINEDSTGVGLTELELHSLCTGIFMSVTGAHRFVQSESYEVFTRAYLIDRYEVQDTSLEEVMYRPIHWFFSIFLAGHEEQRAHGVLNMPLFKVVSEEKVVSLINKEFKTGPDKKFIEYALNNLNYDYWDSDDQYFHEINDVTNYYVNQLNEEFSRTGFPQRSGLAAAFEDLNYVRVFPAHYECLSTLAIPLASEEVSSWNFFNTSPTNRFVSGARTLLAAGYPEHAVVFLSYGLIRICLGIINDRNINFSVQQVNDFVSRPDIVQHVEKYFVPALRFIAHNCKNLAFSTNLWINTTLKNFKFENLQLVDFSANEANFVKKHIVLPDWFEAEDESLLVPINEYLSLTASYQGSDWPRFFVSKDFRSKLKTVAESLELVAIELFRPYFNICQMNEAARKGLMALSPGRELRIDSFNLGWIELFLKRIIDASRQNPKANLQLLKTIQQIDYPLGKAVHKIQQLSLPTLDSFRNFRSIRNALSHRERGVAGSDVMNRSSADWLIGYATRDFSEISELFK